MASIQTNAKSGIHYINWWMDDKQFSKSAKTRERDKAEALLRTVEQTIWKLENGLLTIPEGADVGRFVLSGGREMGKESVPILPPKPLTIREMFEQYRAALPAGAKEQNSLMTERIHANHIQRILKPDTPVGSVSLRDIQEVYAKTRSQEDGRRGFVRSYTVKKELKTFRLVWKWAYDTDRVKTGPAWQVKQVKFGNEVAKPRFETWETISRRVKKDGLSEQDIKEMWEGLFLTGREIRELLDYVERNTTVKFIYPMIALAALTGARRKELLQSRIDDFDFDGKEVTIREMKRVKDKASTRTVEMHPRLFDVMTKWFGEHPGGEFALCNEDGSPLTESQAHHHFKSTLAKHEKWSKVRGFHVLRHSFASILASEGIDQRIINAFMGHMTVEMEQRYRHLIPRRTERPIDRLLPSS